MNSKFGIVTAKTCNLGDDIQAVAASRFLPRIDMFLDRDRLNVYKDQGPIHAILNGWMMHTPFTAIRGFYPPAITKILRLWQMMGLNRYNFPPPDNIKALYTSIHISDPYIVKNNIPFFKKHEPIGCRDMSSVAIFEKYGIKCYFSGCLTLTLQNRYQGARKGVYFVDPFGITKDHRFPQLGDKDFRYDLWDKIPESLKKDAVSLTTYSTEGSFEERHAKALEIIEHYSKAELVITNRIHCALPCLALDTPVIFLHSGKSDIRFKGLTDLMNKLTFDDIKNGKFDEFGRKNPLVERRKEIANALRSKCEKFIASIPA